MYYWNCKIYIIKSQPEQLCAHDNLVLWCLMSSSNCTNFWNIISSPTQSYLRALLFLLSVFYTCNVLWWLSAGTYIYTCNSPESQLQASVCLIFSWANMIGHSKNIKLFFFIQWCVCTLYPLYSQLMIAVVELWLNEHSLYFVF